LNVDVFFVSEEEEEEEEAEERRELVGFFRGVASAGVVVF
jgi:hypothetical protein